MGSRSDAVASASLAKGWTQQGVLMAKKNFTFRRKNEQLRFSVGKERFARTAYANGGLESSRATVHEKAWLTEL